MEITTNANQEKEMIENFSVDRTKRLVRDVSGTRSYTHYASLQALKDVAFYFQTHSFGVTKRDLWRELNQHPMTQLSVALSFLQDRGCVQLYRKKNYPCSIAVLEDAMVEFYALDVAATEYYSFLEEKKNEQKNKQTATD